MMKKLQVWWIPQVPMMEFTVDVETVEEGVKLMGVLADYDRFQFENKVKPDYCNMGGLNQWDDDMDGKGTPGWSSWFDEDTGEDDPIAWLASRAIAIVDSEQNESADLTVTEVMPGSAKPNDIPGSAEEYGQERLVVTPKQLSEITVEDIDKVLTSMVSRVDAKLLAMGESDLARNWFFKWDETASIEWNTYQFCEMLDAHKRSCRRWEEHHNGSCCVVERVRDKYLMPKVRNFLVALSRHGG